MLIILTFSVWFWSKLITIKNIFLGTITRIIKLFRKPTDSESQGRTSGSLTWRLQRGEAGTNPIANHKWIATERDLNSGQMDIRYSSTKDHYERLTITRDTTEITHTLEKWENGVYLANGMFRKEEKDWKMVYISRKG